MKNLNRLVTEVVADLDRENIPYNKPRQVLVNTRYKTTWGRCTKKNGAYIIQISALLLEDSVEDMSAKQTIAHEYLHTCDGCMNHGSKWKWYASRLDKYGYHITRCTSAEDKGVSVASRAERSKYLLTCPVCGCTNRYIRETKAIRSILSGYDRYMCGKCRWHFVKDDVTVL